MTHSSCHLSASAVLLPCPSQKIHTKYEMNRILLVPLLAASSARAFTVHHALSISSSLDRSISSTRIYENAPRHDTGKSDVKIDIDPEEAKVQQAFAEHQKSCPQLGFAESVRTLVQYNHGFGVICTNSKK